MTAYLLALSEYNHTKIALTYSNNTYYLQYIGDEIKDKSTQDLGYFYLRAELEYLHST